MKKSYITPACTSFDIKLEGMIAASLIVSNEGGNDMLSDQKESWSNDSFWGDNVAE